MLDRRQIAQRGIAPAVTPIVRIPPNQGQSNWVAKQVLDIGVYGIIWPHVDTVEEAYNAVAAMRYPRVEGRPLREALRPPRDAPIAPSPTGASPSRSTTPGPTCGP